MSFATVQAQKQQRAYLITAASDTLRGELLKEKPSDMLKKVMFGKEGVFKTYTTTEAKGYGIEDGLRFEAKEVLVDERKQTVFLQVLVDGPVKLYYAKDLHPAIKYFVQKQQEPVMPLHQSYYTGTLSTLLTDCEGIKRQKYKYASFSLSNLVNSYNNCHYAGQKSEVLIKPAKVMTSWGVRAAVHTSRLRYVDEAEAPENHTFDAEPGATAGIFVNIGVAGKRLSLQPELLYTTRTAESTYRYTSKVALDYESHIQLQARYLQVPVLLKYKLSTRKLQPYVNAGLNYGLALSKDFKKTVTYETGHTSTTEMTLDNYTLGYVAGAGLQHQLSKRNAVSLELRFTRDLANSNHVFKKIHFDTWQIAGGFTF